MAMPAMTPDAAMTTATAAEAPPPLGAQWDVFGLDEYLYSLLLGQFLETMDPLIGSWPGGSHQKHERLRTLQSILGACLPAATLWSSQLQTPGTKAVGLRTVMTHESSVKRTKIKYILVTVVIPLAYQFLQRYVVQLQHQQHQDNTPLQQQQQQQQDNPCQEDYELRRIARQRRYQVARQLCQWVELGMPLCKLALLLSMLWQPQISESSQSTVLPPRISMILAGLSFVNASQANDAPATTSTHGRFYVSYAHRRWVMEESLHTFRLVFGPVLTAFQESKQMFQSTVQRLLLAASPPPPDSTPLDAPCPLCGKHPIVIPYETDACDHIFCYTCVWQATRKTSTCPVCRQAMQSSRPVTLQRYRQAAAAQASSNRPAAAIQPKDDNEAAE
jgi:Pex2 / Pex12 amino terminal region/Zinc finger, C3HC4 type (RING finger)